MHPDNLPLRKRPVDIAFDWRSTSCSCPPWSAGGTRIQLPAVIYATMIASIIVFGVAFFGEPEFQTQNPARFLAFNLPYVLIPLLLLVRTRKPLPFTRKF